MALPFALPGSPVLSFACLTSGLWASGSPPNRMQGFNAEESRFSYQNVGSGFRISCQTPRYDEDMGEIVSLRAEVATLRSRNEELRGLQKAVGCGFSGFVMVYKGSQGCARVSPGCKVTYVEVCSPSGQNGQIG